MSTVSAVPATIACAAWRSMMPGLAPPATRDAHSVTNRDLECISTDHIREHARPVLEIDQCDHIRRVRRKCRGWCAVHDTEALHGATTTTFDPFELVGPAMRAQMAWHEMPYAA